VGTRTGGGGLVGVLGGGKGGTGLVGLALGCGVEVLGLAGVVAMLRLAGLGLGVGGGGGGSGCMVACGLECGSVKFDCCLVVV
jgi:hypothetical protein